MRGAPAILRARLSGERAPAACDFGCQGEDCAAELGFPPDPEAEASARAWSLCGGRARRCSPRELAEQDAGEVLLLEGIDGIVAGAEGRRAREAEQATGRR